jgi:hypothetical protein
MSSQAQSKESEELAKRGVGGRAGIGEDGLCVWQSQASF